MERCSILDRWTSSGHLMKTASEFSLGGKVSAVGALTVALLTGCSSPKAEGPSDSQPESGFNLAEWVGTYKRPTSHSEVFTVRGDSTYTFTYGTGGLGFYEKSAKLRYQAPWVLIERPRPPSDGSVYLDVHRFLPVKWGARRFMIAESGVLSFCEAVRLGWRGNEVMGFGHVLPHQSESDFETLKKPMTSSSSMPELPTEFNQWTKKPFEARILSKNRWNNQFLRYTINRGTRDGLAPGTSLIGPYGESFYVDECGYQISLVNPNSSKSFKVGDLLVPRPCVDVSDRNK